MLFLIFLLVSVNAGIDVCHKTFDNYLHPVDSLIICHNGHWINCGIMINNYPTCGLYATNSSVVNKSYLHRVIINKNDFHIKTVHISQMKLNDLVLWPLSDIDPAADKNKNVILRIGYLNITSESDICSPWQRFPIKDSCRGNLCCSSCVQCCCK